MKYKFAVFILSHGRPDKVYTLKQLQNNNYTGDWYIIIDNEDTQREEYIKNFGKDKVVIFDKAAIAGKFDTMDTSTDRRSVVFARNACFDIAEEKGYDYFLELDDDYNAFSIRYIEDGKFKQKEIRNLDFLFEKMLDFLEQSKSLTVAIAQNGDFIGGKDNDRYKDGLLRKAMNTFFCKTSHRFDFLGRINEDVNTYTYLGSKGERIFTYSHACINQMQTQSNSGGMTELYLDSGTYVKSFFSVMIMPSCVSIKSMGDKHKRLHHNVKWDCCVPKIINQRYKKE